MNDTLSRFFRTLVFALLALIGMGMALVFMVSTAIALGVLYLVARVRGKPFGVRAYWNQRQASQPASFARKGKTFRTSDAVDVEVREVR